MTNVKKKYLRGIISGASFLWLMFMVFYLILIGKVPLWNLFGSLPTFFFGLIPLVFLGMELISRERNLIRIMIPVLAFLLGVTQLDLNLFPLKETVRSTPATEIKVFNWNTYYWDQGKDRERFFRFLRKQKADIYVLQEYLRDSFDWRKPGTGASSEHVDDARRFSICSVIPGFPPHYLVVDDTRRLAAEFPGYQIRAHQQFILISRFPIMESHLDYSEQYAVFDLEIGGRLIRCFNVHMLLHAEPGNPLRADFYAGLTQRFLARRLGFSDLLAEIKKTKLNYFIAGDFNSTKAMGVMSELLKGHVDGVKYSGELIPLSFELAGLRLWRFDYGLVPKNNENIKMKSFQTISPEGLSDHNPQVFILNIKPKD